MHQHQVYDTDNHFVIDPITKEIINRSEKMKLMQGDHNSERFTFEIPRYIDGHDMTLCDKIEVHYINIDSKTKESKKDVYIVNDMQLSPNGEDVVIFSWLISANATQLAGTLNFRITFKCISEPSIIDYQMSTEIFKGITVSDGISNSEAVIEQYSDVLEQWKQELNLAGEYAQQIQQNASKIDELNNDLSESRDYVNDVINYEINWNDGGYISKDDGNVYDETGSSYSDYVTVMPGTKLIIANTMTENNEWNAFYDANKTFLSPFSNATGEVIVPDGAVKMRLSKYSTATITIASNIKSYIDDSIENVEANAKLTDDAIAELKGDLDDYKDSISEYHKSVNVFDKSKITDGKVLLGQNNEQTISSCFYTDYIPVEAGKTYCFQDNTGYLGQNGKVICRYDANKTFISSISQSSVIVRDGAVIFSNIRNESKYVRVNGRTSRIDSFMFVEGDTLPSYEPYYEPYYEIKREVLTQMPLPSDAEHNPLYGKKIALNGDSICYGAGSTGGFGKIIADANNMSMSNIAVSGGTLATGTIIQGVNRHWISSTIQNMPNDADYYILDGGINDADTSLGVTLGEITSGYGSTFDTTTLSGAMESICYQLQTMFKGKKYGFIFVHNCYGYTGRWTTEFRPRMKEILKKWGIPYLDLSEECPQLRNIDALRIYTVNNDGWHPTEEGYKLFYVPKITAWMKTL